MKYLIMLYATYNDGTTADKKAIYEATDEANAIATFHSYMGTYMKDTTVSMVTCIAMRADGGIVKSENFVRTTTE